MIYETWGRHDYNPEEFTIGDYYCVIDIGAHIGAFTVFAAKHAKHGQVYAYEPHPENFQLLEENVNLNGLKNVQTFNLGVSGHNGQSKLYIDEANNAGHSMFNVTDSSIAMQLISLSSIFEDNKLEYCDFLKIDCEGAEYEILFNTPRVILDKVGSIIMEYHDSMYSKKTVQDMVKLLHDSHFVVQPPRPKASQGLLYAKKRQ
jgi:FkbM family methyltransferase